jgi:hypothetical protein
MRDIQIDKLCTDWISENCSEEIASQYRPHSLAIPMLNSPELNNALEALREALCTAFGSDESFGTTDCHEARRKLGLPDYEVLIPEVFIMAFTGTRE